MLAKQQDFWRDFSLGLLAFAVVFTILRLCASW
jgi:hypothetical protein